MAAGVGVGSPWLKRVLVATDRSETADKAVRWAANMVGTSQAELLLLQVLVPEGEDGTGVDAADGGVPEATVRQAGEELTRFAQEVAGPRGQARVVASSRRRCASC